MKVLHIIAWVIFTIGLSFKYMHWPSASLQMILGSLLMLIFSIVFLIKNAKNDSAKSFLYLSSTFISTYLMFRFMYWGGAQFLFIFTALISIVTIALHFKHKVKINIKHILIIAYFTGFIGLSFMHSHTLFYITNKYYIEYEPSGEYDSGYPRALDKYSWFLYLAGKYDEAEQMNAKALMFINDQIETEPNNPWLQAERENIEKHKEWILNRKEQVQ